MGTKKTLVLFVNQAYTCVDSRQYGCGNGKAFIKKGQLIKTQLPF